MMNVHEYWIGECLRLAEENAKTGGGPFAAIIVKEGKVIAEGVNLVTNTNDPTAHAEVVAIRSACEKLDSHQLDACTIYCSCEPCPMCFGAIYWARPSEVYYCASKEEANKVGFDDDHIYREIRDLNEERSIPFAQIDSKDADRPFIAWSQNPNKAKY